jgi:hypothetical protein
MRDRGLGIAGVAERMGSGRHYSTVHRVLTGWTRDPTLSTFLDLCGALEAEPADVLRLAGLLPGGTDVEEIRLRRILRRVRDLPEPDGWLAVEQIDALTTVLAQMRGGGAQGERPPEGAESA